MEQFINTLIDSSSISLYTAFLLGILTSISPCTLSTNVMVLGFIGKDISSGKQIFLKGLTYTLGRIVSYITLSIICIPILTEGSKLFGIQHLLSSYSEYLLPPFLILFGLFLIVGDMLRLKKFGFKSSEKTKNLKGWIGTFTLGVLFALAFCPISAVMYFGMLLPMAAAEEFTYLYPIVFAISTGILIIIIAWIMSYSVYNLGKFYNRVNAFQKWFNMLVAIIFILAGIYSFYMNYF